MAAKGALPASVAAQAHVRAVETPVIGLRSGAARRGPADPRLGWRQRSGSQSGSWAATSRPPPACPARSTRRSSSAAPVQASFETGNIQHLMFGIAGIAGNAQPGTAGRGLPSVPPRRHRRYACCSGRHPRLLRPARHRGDPRPGTWALRGRQAAPDDPHDDRLAPRSAGHQLAHGQARGIPGAASRLRPSRQRPLLRRHIPDFTPLTSGFTTLIGTGQGDASASTRAGIL